MGKSLEPGQSGITWLPNLLFSLRILTLKLTSGKQQILPFPESKEWSCRSRGNQQHYGMEWNGWMDDGSWDGGTRLLLEQLSSHLFAHPPPIATVGPSAAIPYTF